MEILTALRLAFTAGVLSFFSPCILPLTPVYVSMVSGLTVEELKSPDEHLKKSSLLFSILLFVLGFSLVYTVLGATAYAVGRVILGYSNLLSKAAGLVLVIFGAVLLSGQKIKFFSKLQSKAQVKKTESIFFPLILGIGTAVGWIPCNAPLLTSALSVSAVANSPLGGLTVSFFYSLGIGVPFIISGLAIGKFLSLFTRYKNYLPVVTFISGLFLIVCGTLMLLGGLPLIKQLIYIF